MDQHPEQQLSGLRNAVEKPAAATQDVDILNAEVESQVLAARDDGATWQTIADTLRTSKQAAWSRYGQRERQAVV